MPVVPGEAAAPRRASNQTKRHTSDDPGHGDPERTTTGIGMGGDGLISRVRGMQDVLPDQVASWHFLEGRARETAARFGFQEIRTPVLEQAELFQHGVGDTTDIVEKEMYQFQDRGGRLLALRPEGTAQVVRALLEAGRIGPNLPSERVFYLQAHYRYERPQAGRLREHHQFGVELVGSPSPRADVEVISLALAFLEAAGLEGLEVHLNSIGDEACRPTYREALVAYATPVAAELCGDCQRRLTQNPLRLLDCKVPADQARMQQAPRMANTLCENCQAHDREVRALLTALGVKVVTDDRLVRGLDYYTRTVFEIVNPALGAEGTVCGGGRYDGLVQQVGGPKAPAVGFGLGLERLLLTLQAVGVEPKAARRPDVYVAVLGEAGEVAMALARDLRQAGLCVVVELEARSLKAQLRQADRLGAVRAVIVGPEEVAQGLITVRDLVGPSTERVQRALSIQGAAETLLADAARDPEG